MRIGLLSDTHGWLHPRVAHYFKDVDAIWHAGDVGKAEVIDELQQIAPTLGVFGNIDGPEVRMQFPEFQLLEINGSRFLLLHIVGRPPRYVLRSKELIAEHKPDYLICGHSHVLAVLRDEKQKLVYLNPGAAGRSGFHQVCTIMRFNIATKGIDNLEAIELGARASIHI